MVNLQGNVITFTVLPDQHATREHISENCEDYGWESDELSSEFVNWLDKVVERETQDNLHYYATVVPDDVSLDEIDLGCFDKYLEKSYEEKTGWLYELRTGFPETIKDNEEVIVLNYNDELHWTDLQLGVITPKCI